MLIRSGTAEKKAIYNPLSSYLSDSTEARLGSGRHITHSDEIESREVFKWSWGGAGWTFWPNMPTKQKCF